MMAADYSNGNREYKNSVTWTPFLKQLQLSSSAWTLYFMNGLSAGAPTVIVPQIRRDWNSTVTIDDELASWLYSMSNLAALPWLFFLPALSQLIGRKIPYLTCCFALTTVFLLLYFGSAPSHILLAEAIQGFVNAIAVTIIITVIPEYCSHKYRTLYLNIQCTTFYWGIWASNAIGTFFNWKYIAVLGLVCSLYTFTICVYPESPRWLASKRKFADCEAAHRWMHGTSPEAEKELRELIRSQVDLKTCSGLMETLTRKQFYKPLLLVILIGAQYNFSGKFVCSMYSLEIIKKITGSDDAAYNGMLILDGFTVFGMYVGSFLSKFLKLRVLYFSLSTLSIIVMLMFSLYLYLEHLEVISENNYIVLSFLVVYSLAISSGPIVLSLNYYSELISIRYQVISYGIVSFVLLVPCTGMLKFAPVIFRELGLHGAFLFYGISCGITTILLYIYLPETKDKTLGEIEEYFKDTVRSSEAVSLTKPVDSEMRN